MNPLEGSMPTIFEARVILAKVTDRGASAAANIKNILTIPNTDKLDKQRSELAAPTTHPVFVCFSHFKHNGSFFVSLADTSQCRGNYCVAGFKMR
jgi:hypothetical protein